MCGALITGRCMKCVLHYASNLRNFVIFHNVDIDLISRYSLMLIIIFINVPLSFYILQGSFTVVNEVPWTMKVFIEGF